MVKLLSYLIVTFHVTLCGSVWFEAALKGDERDQVGTFIY